jgi:phage terminase large subunit-like protein
MNPVDSYARDVVDGRLAAGKYHRLACERHLKDRAREHTSAFPYRFDFAAADRFFKFAGLLKHYKGEWAGQPITLSACQVFRLGNIFGWRHAKSGLRRFTTSYNELPRKSGKSLEAAVVAVYVTFFEGEPGAEGYCVATKLQQAKIVFRDAKKLIKSSGLSSRIEVNAWNLHREATEQKLEPLGSDYSSTDGLNPHLIVTDEFHAHKTRDLIDVMESATGARRNPLHFQITTAGNDPVSPCGDQHDYVCKILDGLLEEDASTVSFFGFIAHADPDDDWLDERTWQKANPHWGISVRPDDMRKLAAKAKNMPSAAAEFQQKRLNLWVNSDQPWLSIDGWRKGQSKVAREAFRASLKGQRCFAGVDLSSKIDLTVVVLLFPPIEARPKWAVLVFAFTPEDTLDERAHRDRAPYRQWKDAGWLETTPGNRIDYDALRDTLRALRDEFDIEQVGFDPWNAGNLEAHLMADGFDVLEVPQTVAHMSAPSKEFEADVLDGDVDSGSNPLMAWCISNVVVQRDNKDNIHPTKKKSRGRIDPVIGAIIARKLAGVDAPAPFSGVVRNLADFL